MPESERAVNADLSPIFKRHVMDSPQEIGGTTHGVDCEESPKQLLVELIHQKDQEVEQLRALYSALPDVMSPQAARALRAMILREMQR